MGKTKAILCLSVWFYSCGVLAPKKPSISDAHPQISTEASGDSTTRTPEPGASPTGSPILSPSPSPTPGASPLPSVSPTLDPLSPLPTDLPASNTTWDGTSLIGSSTLMIVPTE